MSKIQIKDLSNELREENNELKNELKFMKSCVNYLENYRKCLINFNNNCNCDQNKSFDITIKSLEKNYKNVFKVENQIKSIPNEQCIKGIINSIESNNNFEAFNTNKNFINENNLPIIESEIKINENLDSGGSDGNSGQQLRDELIIETVVKAPEVRNITNEKRFKCLKCNQFIGKSDRICIETIEEICIHSYRCEEPECEFESKHLSQMERHLGRHITHCCDWANCGKRFATKGNLLSHIGHCHTKKMPFRCSQCGKRFARKDYLLSHNCVDRTLRCEYPDCEYKCVLKTSLRKHTLMHTNKGDFVCDQIGCGKRFVLKYALNIHYKNVHSSHFYSCEWPGCDVKSRSCARIKEHLAWHLNDRKFKCDSIGCNKSYVTAHQLRQHIKWHTLPHPCTWPGCGQRFCENFRLIAHMNRHQNTGIKCDFADCQKICVSKTHLNSHRKIHTRPLVCSWPECGQRFAVNEKLTAHMNKHQNIRANKCPFDGCDRSYFDDCALRLHIKTKHK